MIECRNAVFKDHMTIKSNIETISKRGVQNIFWEGVKKKKKVCISQIACLIRYNTHLHAWNYILNKNVSLHYNH